MPPGQLALQLARVGRVGVARDAIALLGALLVAGSKDARLPDDANLLAGGGEVGRVGRPDLVGLHRPCGFLSLARRGWICAFRSGAVFDSRWIAARDNTWQQLQSPDGDQTGTEQPTDWNRRGNSGNQQVRSTERQESRPEPLWGRGVRKKSRVETPFSGSPAHTTRLQTRGQATADKRKS